MKRIVLSLAILTTISLTTFANASRNNESHRGHKSPMKELNLTEDQQEKMKSINEDFRNKQRELANSHQADVNAMLTPEQQVKWKELRENRMRNSKSNRKGLVHRGHRGQKDMKWDADTSSKLASLKADFIKEKQGIELTRVAPEEQKRRIDELRHKYRSDRREIINNAKKSDNKES